MRKIENRKCKGESKRGREQRLIKKGRGEMLIKRGRGKKNDKGME